MTQEELRAARVKLAEEWFTNSDLNGDQIVDANGWEDGDKPNELKRTIFVGPNSEDGESVKKTLEVIFPPSSADEIVAAYLPGTNMALAGKGETLMVDGSASYRKPEMTTAQEEAASILWNAIIGVRNVIADKGSGDLAPFYKKVGELLLAKVEGDETGQPEDNAAAVADTMACLAVFTGEGIPPLNGLRAIIWEADNGEVPPSKRLEKIKQLAERTLRLMPGDAARFSSDTPAKPLDWVENGNMSGLGDFFRRIIGDKMRMTLLQAKQKIENMPRTQWERDYEQNAPSRVDLSHFLGNLIMKYGQGKRLVELLVD